MLRPPAISFQHTAFLPVPALLPQPPPALPTSLARLARTRILRRPRACAAAQPPLPVPPHSPLALPQPRTVPSAEPVAPPSADETTASPNALADNDDAVIRADRRLLFRLAAPSYIAQASDPVAAAVDLFFIGKLGPLPLAGAAVGNAVFKAVVFMFNQLSFTTNAIVARAVTASAVDAAPSPSTDPRITRAVASSVVLALFLGGALSLPLLLFAPSLVRGMGASADVLSDASGYLRSRALGIPALLLFFALTGVFRGLADLTRPLVASVLGNAVNVVLDPLLMFGPVAFLGAAGAGYATSVAGFVTVAYLLAYLARSGIVPAKAWLGDAWRVPIEDVKAILGPLVALSSKRLMENAAYVSSSGPTPSLLALTQIQDA
jgi:Na+-driven multidrug efflux pump